MSKEKPKSLGRGLSSLLGEETETEDVAPREGASRLVPVEFLRPGRFQPRHAFDAEAIADLIESVRQRGILQPILVRPVEDEPGRFEIIAGERRWRAAQGASLHEVPVIVRDLSDQEALEVALVENLQRQDLSPLEEAEGYRRLLEEFSHTQEKLALAVGKSRSHVANMMRLLALPQPVKTLLDAGDLSVGHARALLGCADSERLAAEVVERGLNVRQTEKLAQQTGGKERRPQTSQRDPKRDKDADTLALERDLSNLLGMRVTIQFSGREGDLSIHYRTLEQLDDLLHRLTQPSRTTDTREPAQGDNDDSAAIADDDGLSIFDSDLDPLLGTEPDDSGLRPDPEA
ncbi:MAG: ParB/RepB/Spo0J family partition protein [Alphaproteobacteria bacterium]|nr:ParB/RepB/Spo0J family partition protein [Alphaproteobacteria bacterium]